MACRSFDLGNGVSGFICGPRARRKRCTSCGGWADLECDWPVRWKEAADRKWSPAIGDVRVHLRQRRLWWVHASYTAANGRAELELQTTAPGILASGSGLVVCGWDDWFERLSRTCNRPVCRRCATSYKDRLDFCGAHGRLLASSGIWSEG